VRFETIAEPTAVVQTGHRLTLVPDSPKPTSTVTEHLRVWVDGQLFDHADNARIAALDAGVVVGNGVFEALKVTPQGPFAVRRHLDRLSRSAQALAMPAPDHDLIRTGIEAVLDGRGYAEGKVRITYTAGRGPLGSQAAYGPPSVVVAADQRSLAPESAVLVTSPWSRNEHGALAGVKSTSYAENVRNLAYATERGASEALLLNTAGRICEGTGSNIFCVFGSEIVTPPLASGPLAGITRQLVLEWCAVTEADLTLAEAQGADEVFLTSSLRDVQAVRRWDDLDLSAPGPVTKEVAATFAERSTADIEP
jgi:branched-chain amino acid aminotransferase